MMAVPAAGPPTRDDAEYTARTVHALADGRPIYVRAPRRRTGGDARPRRRWAPMRVSALRC